MLGKMKSSTEDKDLFYDILLNPESPESLRFSTFCKIYSIKKLYETDIFTDIRENLYPEWNRMISFLPGLKKGDRCFSNTPGTYDLEHIKALLRFCDRLSRNNITWNSLGSVEDNIFKVIKAFQWLIDDVICRDYGNIYDSRYRYFFGDNMWRAFKDYSPDVFDYECPTDEDFNITRYYPTRIDINLLSEKYYIISSGNIRPRTKR